MVSIRESLDELEAAYRVRMAALECYRGAVQSAGQYAVDFETSVAEKHRRDLEALAGEIAGNLAGQSLPATLSRFRGLLRDYRDRGAAFLANLQRELTEKATSLEQIFHAMAEGDGEHEFRLRQTIRNLRDLAARPEAKIVSGPLSQAASALDESLEEMKKHHQMTVAQFLVEIRMLHSRIRELETPSGNGASDGLGTREDLEMQLDQAIAVGTPFFLIMLRMRNLGGVQRQFPGIENDLLTAFSKRVRNCVNHESFMARWNDNSFAVLEFGSKAESLGAVRRIAEHAGGVYAIQTAGRLVRPILQISAGAVEAQSGGTRAQLSARVEQFLTALS